MTNAEKYDYINQRINLECMSCTVDLLGAILQYSEKHNNSTYNHILHELLQLAFSSDLEVEEIEELCK